MQSHSLSRGLRLMTILSGVALVIAASLVVLSPDEFDPFAAAEDVLGVTLHQASNDDLVAARLDLRAAVRDSTVVYEYVGGGAGGGGHLINPLEATLIHSELPILVIAAPTGAQRVVLRTEDGVVREVDDPALHLDANRRLFATAMREPDQLSGMCIMAWGSDGNVMASTRIGPVEPGC